MDVYEVVEDNMRWLYEQALSQALREADDMALQERMDRLTVRGMTDQPSESLHG